MDMLYCFHPGVYAHRTGNHYSKGRRGPQAAGGGKVAGRSRYEKIILWAGVCFLLLSLGMYALDNRQDAPWQVTTARRENPHSASSETENADWPESLLPGEKICVNTAEIYELTRLPGIGSKRAEAIVAYRKEHGPFEKAEDLLEVPGVGEVTLQGIREYILLEQTDGKGAEYGENSGSG